MEKMMKNVSDAVKGDIVVEHSEELRLRNFKIPFVGVYDHPLDYPEKVVARVFDVDKPTRIVMLKDTVEEIDAEMAKTNLVKFARGAADDPKLVCCWG